MASPTTFYDYITVVTNIDRKKYGHRIVPCKVLMLGLGRTGTFSLVTALKQLGFYEAYHGYAATFDNPRDCEMWCEALEAKFEGRGQPYGRAQFDQLLGHCQAVSDMPATCFAKELIEAYPEAKVILTLRKDVDAWYNSMLQTIDARTKNPLSRAMAPLATICRLHSRFIRPCFEKCWYYTYGGDFSTNGKRVYSEHNDMIRSLVPKDRLLEYHIEEGWEPVCKFLGTVVPTQPFPQGNEKAVFQKRFEKAFLLTCIRVATRLSQVAFGALCLAYWFQWMFLRKLRS